MSFLQIIVMGFLMVSCNNDDISVENLSKPTEEIDKVSYSIGYGLGNQLRMDSLEPNYKYLILGIQKALKNDTSFISQMEVDMAMMEWQDRKRMEREKADSAIIARSATENPMFLEENKKKSGVKVTATGLQYEILQEGDGKIPQGDDLVTVHVIGRLRDGKEFDNTYTRGQSYTVPVTGGLRGWGEALMMMKTGSKWRIVLPPELGLGTRGGGEIPPNSILIFEIELLTIEGKAPQVQPQMQQRMN